MVKRLKILSMGVVFLYSHLNPAIFNLSPKVEIKAPQLNTPHPQRAKKKIVAFTCDGGGGHQSVSSSLNVFLQSDYEVQHVNILTDILSPIDPVKWLTKNKYNCEDFYNYCLKKQWVWVVNNLCIWGSKVTLMKKKAITELVKECLDREQPDIIASVMPIFNHSILQEAKKRNLPFVVITNDLDTRNYLNGIYKPKYDKFKYVLTFDDSDIRERIKRAQLREDQIEVLGFPIRPDFFEKKDVASIKREFSLPKNKPVVMILMGGQGSEASIKYAQTLSKLDIPMHLVFCLGKNEKAGDKIRAIKFKKDTSIATIGFTKRISDLMAASDVIITKSGPNSISEAMYMNLPMIVDNTSNVFFWERLNVKFVEKNKLGLVVRRHGEVNKSLKKFLTDKGFYNKIKTNIVKFQKNNFGASIKNLFNKLS